MDAQVKIPGFEVERDHAESMLMHAPKMRRGMGGEWIRREWYTL